MIESKWQMPNTKCVLNKLAVGALALCSLLMGCGKEVELPIEPEKLAIVLRDVHVAEASILHLKSSQKDSILGLYYEQICEIHNVKKADLDSCLAILKREPELAFGQYEKVFEEMEKLNLQNE